MRPEEMVATAVLWFFALFGALATAAILGTDQLGRPLTDEEKKRMGALLREHDYPNARLVALRFAYKLTRGRGSARDLMGRVDLRLVREGWHPMEVSLKKRLCRLVWSEWTHAGAESEKARRAEAAFLQEEQAQGAHVTPSIEQRVIAKETETQADAHGRRQLERLRALFTQAGDTVNLLWLDASLEEDVDAPTLAARTGRDVEEFYAAAKRRKRAVRRLLAEGLGAPYPEESER